MYYVILYGYGIMFMCAVRGFKAARFTVYKRCIFGQIQLNLNTFSLDVG